MSEVVVESLNKSFNSVQALKALRFSVEKASMYGFIGPDGAGKTTFMRIATCLLFQDSGSVSVCGFDTLKSSADIKRIIGYMPQNFSQYPDLSVEENLFFFADLFGVGKKEGARRIESLLEFSKLGPFLKRRAGKLSGGMKRKLALSCTLIHNPKVLFLDEPTTGVDPVSRREFWNILGEVKQNGTTIIVSTPYMDEAERCDRVGLLLNGSLIGEGTPDELTATFSKEIISVHEASIVRKTRHLAFPNIVLDVTTFGDQLHLTVENAGEATVIVREFLKEHGIRDVIIEPVKPSMENIFMERMANES